MFQEIDGISRQKKLKRGWTFHDCWFKIKIVAKNLMFQGQKSDMPGTKQHMETLSLKEPFPKTCCRHSIHIYIYTQKEYKTNQNYPPTVTGGSSGKIWKQPTWKLTAHQNPPDRMQGSFIREIPQTFAIDLHCFYFRKKGTVIESSPWNLPSKKTSRVTMSHWANRFIIRSPSFHDVSSSSLPSGGTTDRMMI